MLQLAGDLEAIALAYTRAVQWAIETDDDGLNNQICWIGSIDGFAEIVLPACEHAVELEPDNGNYRDSRELARALTGDYAGAIEYFEFYLTQNDDPQREDWTAKLEVGRNPFDEVTLEELWNQ